MCAATSTYVLMRRIAELDLAVALRHGELSETEDRFFSEAVLSRVSRHRPELNAATVETKRRIIQFLRRADSLLAALPGIGESVRDDLIVGLSRGQLQDMVRPHSIIQGRTEGVVRGFVAPVITEQYMESVRDRTNIQRRAIDKLLYQDLLKLAKVAAEDGCVAEIGTQDRDRFVESINRLLADTVEVRNALAHNELHRISLDDYARAIITHLEFLIAWEPAKPA